MPFANNQDVRIHFQVVGKGTPLLLLHGLFASWGDWFEAGYVERLKHSYQLLLVDARGHGASDKPHEAKAYSMDLLVNDMVAVLDAVNIPKAHFWGYSWGAGIGYAVGQHAMDRFHSLILGGHGAQENDPGWSEYIIGCLHDGVETFASILDQFFEPSSGYKARRLASDFEALIAVSQSLPLYPPFVEMLPQITLPCLLYTGEADYNYPPLKENASRIPNSIFISLPDLDHIQALTRSEVVLPHVIKFLSEVSEA
jgi:pimeloyl-ACP methyl ester carboxylesterase